MFLSYRQLLQSDLGHMHRPHLVPSLVSFPVRPVTASSTTKGAFRSMDRKRALARRAPSPSNTRLNRLVPRPPKPHHNALGPCARCSHGSIIHHYQYFSSDTPSHDTLPLPRRHAFSRIFPASHSHLHLRESHILNLHPHSIPHSVHS